jgi:hypothetical protein
VATIVGFAAVGATWIPADTATTTAGMVSVTAFRFRGDGFGR